jgi:hypothetical protein
MRFFIYFTALTTAVSTTGWAADIIRCPAKIEVNQRLAGQAPGWSVMSDPMPHLLAGLTFFDGNPSEKASLAPDKQLAGQYGIQSTSVALWIFPPSSRPTWVSCSYAWTDVVLARELPKGTRTCSVTYSTRDSIAGSPVIEKVDCR